MTLTEQLVNYVETNARDTDFEILTANLHIIYDKCNYFIRNVLRLNVVFSFNIRQTRGRLGILLREH